MSSEVNRCGECGRPYWDDYRVAREATQCPGTHTTSCLEWQLAAALARVAEVEADKRAAEKAFAGAMDALATERAAREKAERELDEARGLLEAINRRVINNSSGSCFGCFICPAIVGCRESAGSGECNSRRKKADATLDSIG